MGCMVHPPGNADTTDWGMLAGYEGQKQVIEDGLLGPLTHPEVYEAVAARTRKSPASNRPRAVLFEGPPGCGKTTSARCVSCVHIDGCPNAGDGRAFLHHTAM